MTESAGRRILTLHPGNDLCLQDQLLSCVEQVLSDAGATRIWIQASPEDDLRVYAELPGREDAEVIDLAERAPREGLAEA
ncbi:MAG: hypothetical protein ABF306_03880 [Nocardioides marinisabuli]|uniref:hypothetical protein n=1 Tax=Nocardioides marinisabuli TaxID=419476 RepID=UPI00321A0EE1